MLDGARNALLGYLYQLLGTAAISIQEVSPGADAFAQLIASVGQGELISEEFGQDAVVHPAAKLNQGMTAIQFKHSATSERPIRSGELIDILSAFDQSRRETKLRGDTISHYVLVTNRRLDSTAQSIFDCGTSAKAHQSLTLRPKRGKYSAANLKLLKPYEGDPGLAAAAWHRIIQSLGVYTGMTFEASVTRLRSFAAKYGVLDHEWELRLNSIVGAFIQETSDGQHIAVTCEWLKKHMIGDSNAANLRFACPFQPHISIICRDLLDSRIKDQHRVPPEFYLDREVQQEIRLQLEQYPVVFVAGGGGRGKSLTVANYLRSVADRQLVWSEGAATASESELVTALTLARLPGGLGSVDRFLRDIRVRLNVANKPQRPLWTIDLDGVDEAPDRVSQLRNLIRVCWAQGRRDASPASVLVSCRSETGSRAKENLISKWLDTPDPRLVDGVGFVELDNFVGDELVHAASLLNGAPEQRIILAASLEAAPQRPPTVSTEILQSLRHPVVWGEYASLDPARRNGILDHEQVQLDHLAEQLHERFLRRCRDRKFWRDGLMLECTLPEVARVVTGAPPYSSESWDQACQLCLDRTEARYLYDESLSYGIIERDSGPTWRWRHQFLLEYLRRRHAR